MKLTTITMLSNRPWEIQFYTVRHTNLIIDFINPVTGESISGLTYSLIDDTYQRRPPFNPLVLEVCKDGEKLFPMNVFVDRLILLISISDIIKAAIKNDEAKAGWNLKKPSSNEEYMDIATKDEDEFIQIICLGIDTIRAAIENGEFYHSELTMSQFQEVCGFLSTTEDYDILF